MQSDKTLSDLLIANAAKDAQRYIQQLKFLEGEIKTLDRRNPNCARSGIAAGSGE